MNAVNAEFIDYAGFEPDGGTDRTERIAVAPAAERTQRITRVRQAAARVPEGSILRVLFVMLLTATAFVLAADISEINKEISVSENSPITEPIDPVEMPLPKPNDQRRPYLHKSSPVSKTGGKLAIPGYEQPPKPADLDHRMEFRLAEDGQAAAVGRIEIGSAEDLVRFLSKHKGKVHSLTLHSPGGSVPDALDMARAIRDNGLSTIVATNGYCASSCPLAFSGGVVRTAGDPSWIGVHQVFTDKAAIGTIHEGLSQGQAIGARCEALLADMGVDLKVWVHAMETPSDELYVFTAQELADLKLVTAPEASAVNDTGVLPLKTPSKAKLPKAVNGKAKASG